MKLLSPAILVLAAALIFSAEGAPSDPKQIFFEGLMGIPVRLPDGTLLALAAQGRPLKEMANDGPAQPVFARSSHDDGQTWSAPVQVFAYPAGRGSVTQLIYPLVDKDGHLHAFGLRYFRLPSKENRGAGECQMLHNVSRDGGKTWSPARPVNFGHAYTGAINSIIQLSSGRLLGALSYASDNFLDNVGQIEFRSLSFYSDDDGETWKMGTDNIRVPFGPQITHPGAIEPILMEMRDRRVWMIIRTQTLRFWEIFSRDGGQTWTSPVASRFMAPDSPGAIHRLKDGRLVLVWNDIMSYPNGVTGHYRQYLYAALSGDDGKTWTKPQRVGPLDQADKEKSRGDYPYLCETTSGKLLLTYYRFGLGEKASYEYPYLELVRIDPDWLAASRHP
jgi:hypothetical protein